MPSASYRRRKAAAVITNGFKNLLDGKFSSNQPLCWNDSDLMSLAGIIAEVEEECNATLAKALAALELGVWFVTFTLLLTRFCSLRLVFNSSSGTLEILISCELLFFKVLQISTETFCSLTVFCRDSQLGSVQPLQNSLQFFYFTL